MPRAIWATAAPRPQRREPHVVARPPIVGAVTGWPATDCSRPGSGAELFTHPAAELGHSVPEVAYQPGECILALPEGRRRRFRGCGRLGRNLGVAVIGSAWVLAGEDVGIGPRIHPATELASGTTFIGWVASSMSMIFITESRTSSAASYSRAWARNAVWSRSSRWPPEAIFIWTRIAAPTSWVASSPARSPDSSALRAHSESACPLRAWPSSWPSTNRSSSSRCYQGAAVSRVLPGACGNVA